MTNNQLQLKKFTKKKVAIFGGTGFVGSAFSRHIPEADIISSVNKEKIYKKKYDLIIISSAPGAKWIANQDPDRDFKLLNEQLNILDLVDKDTDVVLISTIDIYSEPVNVCELNLPSNIQQSRDYGSNRAFFEISLNNKFKNIYTYRLPGLVGKGLKKNFLYDLKNNKPITLKQGDTFQYLDIDEIVKFILRHISNKDNYRLVNITSEPVSCKEICTFLGLEYILKNMSQGCSIKYDVQSCNSDLINFFSDEDYGYIYSKNQSLEFIRNYFNS